MERDLRAKRGSLGGGPALEFPDPRRADEAPQNRGAEHVRYSETKRLQPPAQRLRRSRVIGDGTPGEIVSAYKMLRTQVLRRLDENGWRTVAVTSPSRGSGATLTAVNLAISIARDLSHTVLLVELDFGAPRLRDMLGLDPGPGISDHLLGGVPLRDILVNPGIERLVVIPAGRPVSNSSELLSSPRMTALVDELKHRYDDRIVLFDLPPTLAIDDAMAFSRFVDCALLVVKESETRVREMRRAIGFLRATQMLGVVLNQSAHALGDGSDRSA